MNGSHDAHLIGLWHHLGGSPDLLGQVEIDGPEVVLPSMFDVTGFAAAAVAAANLAAAELLAARAGSAVGAVTADRRAAAATFSCERLLAPIGWELPPVWDPIAGDYRTSDGWIRLHTNYEHHRDAVVATLGVPADRQAVTDAVADRTADELETAVVEHGGCAAAMRTTEAWRSHPAGRAAATEPPVALHVAPHSDAGAPAPPRRPDGSTRPLAGVRVLDLTRVIAGPVATRYLAAHGADVLRIDPPGFAEVGALLPETTRGKRCAALDLRVEPDRRIFERLVTDADVIVVGLRPGATDGLGYDAEALRRLNPALITVRHDAYGWTGPWAGRRGFDSLVQMSCGIAAAGAAATGTDRPTPLPVQALDHGTGFLLAAAACRALTELATTGVVHEVRASLVGTANALMAHPTPGAVTAPGPEWTDADTEPATSAWGPLRSAPVPAGVSGVAPAFVPDLDAGPLGRHEPEFGPLLDGQPRSRWRMASTSSAIRSSAMP